MQLIKKNIQHININTIFVDIVKSSPQKQTDQNSFWINRKRGSTYSNQFKKNLWESSEYTWETFKIKKHF